MAPITRNQTLVPFARGRNQLPAQQTRDFSWNFGGSDTRSERDASDEPPASYDPEMDEDDERDDTTRRLQQGPQTDTPDTDAILHPLRETANRVGREVERFAEVLDGYNPQRTTEDDERHGMMTELIRQYHGIAEETVKALRTAHASEIKKLKGTKLKKKMRGFEVEDEDEDDDLDMDMEEIVKPPPVPLKTTMADLTRWEQEAQTWDLLGRLVELRFPSPNSKGNSLKQRTPIHQYSSEADVWNDFVEKDDLALERITVLQWLKDSADESGEDISNMVHDLQQNAERGDMISQGWIHTKNFIRGSRLGAIPRIAKVGETITELDPDAVTRQGGHLEKQDEYFERAIWLGCYELLRRGKSMGEMRTWCDDRTEIWRAISMSGFPNRGTKKPDNATDCDPDPVNPESRALWRRMCFALARNAGGDAYKLAVYGILSGDLESVKVVCRSWDDLVFAHYNSLLTNQFDNYLQQLHPFSQAALNFESFDAIQFHGKPSTAAASLIEALKTDPRTTQETSQPMKMLQGVLIADTFSNFIYQQGLALSKYANEHEPSKLFPPNPNSPENEESMKYVTLKDHDSLRVLAHVLLIFMGLGLDLGSVMKVTEVENVVVAYISFLRLSGKEELIPLYCSQLTGKRKYAILCRNLIDVTDYNQRVTQIKLMRELGLDAQEFVSSQARFLQADYRDQTTGYPASKLDIFEDLSSKDAPKLDHPRVHFFSPDSDKVDRIDMLLIRSMEWYLLVDGMWNETFTLGTMLYMRFFKTLHLNAARTMGMTVDYKRIVQAKTRAILGEYYDASSLENEDDEDMTEVLDGSADERRQMRKCMVAQAKSFRELEALIDCLDYVETSAELQLHMRQNAGIPGKLKNSRQHFSSAAEGVSLTVQPLLKGWLLTCQDDDMEEEFQLLREAYLPQVILAYISIMRFAGGALSRKYLMECMELSALLAEEGSDLLDLFVKTGQMQDLMNKLAGASKDLLILSSTRPSTASRGKKMRMKGWTHELWSVKP